MNPKTPPTSYSSSQAAHTLGLEMEMAVAHQRTGRSLPVRRYFGHLQRIKHTFAAQTDERFEHTALTSLMTDTAHCGLDNGWNLLETSLFPVSGRPNSFQTLAQRAHCELADTLVALQEEQATVLNVSQHPACAIDAQWYGRVVAPHPIYFELRGHRGWHHWHGIDAKAQNGANTSMPVGQIVQGLNGLLALSAAFIALFANSPLSGGLRTGFKEHRMTIWPRVFGPARFRGDLTLATYPARPFRDLADFFNWMFGPGTVSRGLPLNPAQGYKTADVVILSGHPCLRDFLQQQAWPAYRLGSRSRVMLEPRTEHFVYSQIGQFLDARIRYKLKTVPELQELMQAWSQEGELEALFERCGADMYLEARSPGANFADAVLLSRAGASVASTVLMAPLALQAGLLSSLDQVGELIREWGWAQLGAMRHDAMRQALADDSVRRLCQQVVQVAHDGLLPQERQWLAYTRYVLESRCTGADRLLETWNTTAGDESARLERLCVRHAALHPQEYAAL